MSSKDTGCSSRYYFTAPYPHLDPNQPTCRYCKETKPVDKFSLDYRVGCMSCLEPLPYPNPYTEEAAIYLEPFSQSRDSAFESRDAGVRDVYDCSDCHARLPAYSFSITQIRLDVRRCMKCVTVPSRPSVICKECKETDLSLFSKTQLRAVVPRCKKCVRKRLPSYLKPDDVSGFDCSTCLQKLPQEAFTRKQINTTPPRRCMSCARSSQVQQNVETLDCAGCRKAVPYEFFNAEQLKSCTPQCDRCSSERPRDTHGTFDCSSCKKAVSYQSFTTDQLRSSAPRCNGCCFSYITSRENPTMYDCSGCKKQVHSQGFTREQLKLKTPRCIRCINAAGSAKIPPPNQLGLAHATGIAAIKSQNCSTCNQVYASTAFSKTSLKSNNPRCKLIDPLITI
jgi:hypothetical protein